MQKSTLGSPEGWVGSRAFDDAFEAHRRGQLKDAASTYRRLVADVPDHADALHLLGVALAQTGSSQSGALIIRRVFPLRPSYAEAWCNYANALSLAGPTAAAASAYRRAVALKPDYVEALNCLSNFAMAAQRVETGVRWLRCVLAIAPDFPQARLRLGLLLKQLRRWDEAAAELTRLLDRDPDNGRAHVEMGNILLIQGHLGLATLHGRRAIALVPEFMQAHYAYAITCSVQHALDASIRFYRRMLSINPDHVEAHSNLIFALDFVPGAGIAEQQRERRRWYDLHGRRWAPAMPVRARDLTPERKLRIGYVSADFRGHSAAFVFGPAILNHDHTRFEVTLYSGVEVEDSITARFRERADHYRPTAGMSDDRMAAMIREDEIDILVDLSGHSAGNRLLVFARKPAPIQASGWGHATATGLATIDYFLADPVFVPDEAYPHFAERIFNLPCFLPYFPQGNAPPVAPSPVSTGAPLTFGCFNRLVKLSGAVIDLWSRLLVAVPGSRLLLKDGQLSNVSARRRILDEFGRRGVPTDRLLLRGRTSYREQLAAFGEVDVALDPFPHNGGVSTFEALWMGVPVVTKLGASLPGRNGGAILSALGFAAWVAETNDGYVDIARRLSGDRAALSQFRTTLRPTLMASVVCDPIRYCRAAEAAYREMWRRYCREIA